jgi:hypothetical protein
MKNIMTVLLGLMIVSNVFAGTKPLTCVTKAREGYYVKKIMRLAFTGEKSIFVQPYDSDGRSWYKGSTGKLMRSDPNTGWSRFSGFDSQDMFGDLSEGGADLGISLYVSPVLASGQGGPVSLYAKGGEVGLEKATYYCR